MASPYRAQQEEPEERRQDGRSEWPANPESPMPVGPNGPFQAEEHGTNDARDGEFQAEPVEEGAHPDDIGAAAWFRKAGPNAEARL